MTNPLSWSTTAASNTSVAGVSIAEGWAPASVNNALRGMMADLSKLIKDTGGALVTTGTATAYALTTNMAVASYAAPLTLTAKTHITNTGAATLSVDGLAAKSIRRGNGAVLAAGDLVLGGIFIFVYDAITDVFYVINPVGAGVINTTIPPAAGGTGITAYQVGDLIYASATTTLARLIDIALGNVLLSGGPSAAPFYGKVGLTTHVSGLLPIANGGTGASSVSAARTSLGVQAADATLTALAGLTTAANQAIYSTGVDTFAMTGLSSFGRNLIDDADQATAQGTLGLQTMALQAADAVAITGGSIDVPTLKVGGVAIPQKNAANIFTAAQNITLATASAVPLTLTSTESAAAVGPTLALFRDSVSPFTGDLGGAVTFTARNSVGGLVGYGSIQSTMTDVTAGSEDGSLYLATAVGGASVIVAKVGPGLVVGTPTGGDKGLGTINAQGVYDDNTLLTGYVFDAALDDGLVDKAKWDAISPHGMHEPARRFSDMLESEQYNPLDIDGFSRFWKTYRHLPSLPDEEQPTLFEPPSTGQWIQMLVETVELLAVHIEWLHRHVKQAFMGDDD